VLAIVSPWVFVANLAPLLRAGPEGYKGLVIEGFLIPMITLSLACRPAQHGRRVLARYRRLMVRNAPVTG
jgi:hypothetical protein